MINRRYLRVKALLNYYAFIQAKKQNVIEAEKQLLISIDKVYDLFIYQLSFILEVFDFAANKIEEAKHKHLLTPEDINPNTIFIDNKIINQLSNNKSLKDNIGKLFINWKDSENLIRNTFNDIKKSSIYQKYISSDNISYDSDKDFLVRIFKKKITSSANLHSIYEEMNIHWYDDFYMANNLVIKFLSSLTEDWNIDTPMPNLYKYKLDKDDEDKQFVKKLFKNSLKYDVEHEEEISKYLTNWEPDRIALLDMLIMKMSLTELKFFPSIPIKATLNEFIEISKEYSTPKSNIFINGVLDRMIRDMKKEGKIKKVGRGLKEN